MLKMIRDKNRINIDKKLNSFVANKHPIAIQATEKTPEIMDESKTELPPELLEISAIPNAKETVTSHKIPL